MKKKLIIIATLLVLATCIAFAENPELIKAEKPVLVTSFGQNPDTNFVKTLAKRVKLDIEYYTAIQPKDIDWSSTRTIICVLGGSSKGLGQAGLDADSEIKRCNGILEEAKKNGVTVIGMHLGGQDRMGPNSQNFLPYAGLVDYMVVKTDVGVLEYFQPLCEKAGVPLYVVKSTTEIAEVLKGLFSL